MTKKRSALTIPTKLDPVLVEVMRHELVGLTEEMNITMRQTTRSVMARESNDFSSALLDAAGTVVAQAVPYGLSVFAFGVPHVIAKFAGRFRPGDVLVSNDPYRGVSHLPDILVVMPIFSREDLVGFAATFQHHTDMGGRFPGGYGTESTQLYEEGLCLPIVHYYREGRPETGVLDIIAANVRAPADVLGDLEANVAACRRGARGMLELLEKYGRATVDACCVHFVQASASHMQRVIRSIPDGSYRVKRTFDDGVGTRFDLALTLGVEGSSLTVDLTGSSQQVDTAWNIPPGLAMLWVLAPLLGLMRDPELVLNAGLIEGVRVVAPAGTVVNPIFPGAVASRAQTGYLLTEMMSEALAMAAPGLIPAAGDGGATVLVFTGSRRDGKVPSVLTDVWSCGWGARPDRDGIDGVVSLLNTGLRTSSGEVMEVETSVALDGFGYVADTGGAGTFRGSVSLYRRFRFGEDGRAMLRTCRWDSIAPGLDGGHGGGPFSAKLIRDGVETQLPRRSVLDIAVKAGDVVEHIGPGGSGYGDPLQRDPQLVLADVLDEKVSAACAESIYGVAVDLRSWTIDAEKTAAMRRSRVQWRHSVP